MFFSLDTREKVKYLLEVYTFLMTVQSLKKVYCHQKGTHQSKQRVVKDDWKEPNFIFYQRKMVINVTSISAEGEGRIIHWDVNTYEEIHNVHHVISRICSLPQADQSAIWKNSPQRKSLDSSRTLNV